MQRQHTSSFPRSALFLNYLHSTSHAWLVATSSTVHPSIAICGYMHLLGNNEKGRENRWMFGIEPIY
jgi:hypothetical protein